MVNVPNSDPAHVISFVRDHRGGSPDGELIDGAAPGAHADTPAASRIFAIFNLSPEVRTVELHEGLFPGDYTDVFTGDLVRFEVEAAIELEPWTTACTAPEPGNRRGYMIHPTLLSRPGVLHE